MAWSGWRRNWRNWRTARITANEGAMDGEASMVIVFGSVNLDLSVPVQQAPRAGETVLGGALLVDGGGKGANQAHAARRYGARVALAGAVGDDALGAPALANLERAGVGLGALRRVAGMATGSALITLDAHGENRIVVAPGANAAACADAVTDADLACARVLLLQLEVPFEESRQLARRARAGLPGDAQRRPGATGLAPGPSRHRRRDREPDRTAPAGRQSWRCAGRAGNARAGAGARTRLRGAADARRARRLAGRT
jgi:hypothetical protein